MNNIDVILKISFWFRYFFGFFYRHKKGFGVLEILLSGSIFVLLLISVTGLLLYSRDSLSKDNLSAQASLLANEGMVAVENIKNNDFSNLSDGVHGLIFFGGEWGFMGKYDEVADFKRTITISTVSENEKRVVVEVTWSKKFNRLGRVTLSKYFTNWTEPSNNIVEAEQLNINISNSTIINNQINGTLISNLGPQKIITIKQIKFDWMGVSADKRIAGINIDGNNIWSGSANSGEIIDVNSLSGFELDYVQGNYPINFNFNDDVAGIEMVIRFIMMDDSEKQVVLNFSGMIDTISPGAINDLSVFGSNYFSVNLGWTAPGDDDYTGTATSYEIRYATSYIDDSNWDSALIFSSSSLPSLSGTPENIIISGLDEGITYYFAIKTLDEVGNISPISNIASTTTEIFWQADYLSVDTSGAYVGAGNPDNRRVFNIFLTNNSSRDLTLVSIELDWTGGSKINETILNSTSVNSNNNSPYTIVFTDYVINFTDVYILNFIFQKKFPGETINSMIFNFSDGSSKTVGPISF